MTLAAVIVLRKHATIRVLDIYGAGHGGMLPFGHFLYYSDKSGGPSGSFSKDLCRGPLAFARQRQEGLVL